jgi:hypothetical protein
MRIFSQAACVDWSGAIGERPPGIAVATALAGQAPILLRPTHRWSRHDVLDWLLTHAEAKTDIVIGLDLSFGFPFADQSAYFPQWPQSPPDARMLWKLIDDMCAADPHLSAPSFLKHEQARRHFRHAKGDVGDLFGGGIGRLRLVEHHQRITKQANSWSCFNLVGAGQVGKSSLTGMRMLHQLAGRIPIWPFDPIPDRGPVLIEIYTSMAARAAGMPPGHSKIRDRAALIAALTALGSPSPARLARYDDHATDALITAAWLQKSIAISEFWIPTKLTSKISATEGWTFGVI